MLFSDGLRFDLGRQLAMVLEARHVECDVAWRLAALPTDTPTAKPAVTPVAGTLAGGAGLVPTVRNVGTPVNAEVLRKLLGAAGFQVLRGEEAGDPTGRGWTELGDVDSYGHDHGWKVAHRAPEEIRTLVGRVLALLDAGWKEVVIVTDHGWLMLPGGLPKATLPEHLTEVRKGRCARLKASAQTDEPWAPWHWDRDVRVATPRGIHCYEAGREYDHGGISPQECVLPVIRATRGKGAAAANVAIECISWRGLWCSIVVAGAPTGAIVDIRTKAADPKTSLTDAAKSPGAEGKVSLLVQDEDRTGQAAHVVVIGAGGVVLAQTTTSVGG